jgi:hypothetical protein
VSQLLVVNGNGTDIIVKGGNGVNAFETTLTETEDGDILFVLNSVLRTYAFDPESIYIRHKVLIGLEAGTYTPRDCIQFICRGMHDAVVKFSWESKRRTQLNLYCGEHLLVNIQRNPKPHVRYQYLESDWLARFNVTELADSFIKAADQRVGQFHI